MKTRSALILLGMLALGQLRGFANVSAWQSGVPATGNLAASDQAHQTSISIEDENLIINLHQEYAEVSVRYRMHNAGGKVKQGLFFPVEKWATDLENYQIFVDDKAVEWSDAKVEGREKAVPDSGGWETHPKVKSWKKSVIPFQKGETREVLIRYNAKYAQRSHSVSENLHNGPKMFEYALSPAATWYGPIKKGRVVVNVLHPEPEDVSFIMPRSRFSKINESRWEWAFQDLKPTLDDDIKIAAHSADTRYGAYVFRGNQYFLCHHDYEAKASSTLKSDGEHVYEVENIRSFDQNTTWAEGVAGDGVGEWITLEVKHPLPLDAILIIPGYGGKNEAAWGEDRGDVKKNGLWLKNNRVAQLEVTLNDEHTFSAAIPDEEFSEYYPILVRGYSKPVRTIKLVIKGVHRGTQFQDTCVSLISLRAKLSKKPKINPAR